MKNKLIIIGGIILIVLFGIILYFSLKPTKNNIETIIGSDLVEKLNQKETFILLVSQDGCSHCEEYKPILNRVLEENNKTAYEIEWKEIRNHDKLKNLFNINGTPTTIFINDGIEKTTINRLVGSTTYNDLKNKLKERGFID